MKWRTNESDNLKQRLSVYIIPQFNGYKGRGKKHMILKGPNWELSGFVHIF